MKQRGIMKRSTQAFTLVELTIVLAIVGLVVGGITVGTSLQHQQQIRNVMQDATSYAIAAQQFQQQYNGVPGDFATAMNVWPAAAANGNGDGFVNVTDPTNESFLYWQHLNLAGLIQGNYSGQATAAGAQVPVIGTNAPPTAVKGTTFIANSFGTLSGDATFFDGDYRNVLMTIRTGAVINSVAVTSFVAPGAFTGAEAAQLDAKFDDGYPHLGNIRTVKTYGTNNHGDAMNCIAAAGTGYVYRKSNLTIQYTSQSDSVMGCPLIFMSGWQARNLR